MENFFTVARRWYEKAGDSNDSFDQFISIWISFNALYGRREGYEFEKIKSIINEFNRNTVVNILSYDEVQFFCNIEPAIQFINKNQEVNDTAGAQNKLKRNIIINPRIALEELMYILNKVRNNLFHGDKRIERSRDVDIVRHAYPIVREIVKSYLRLDENDRLSSNELREVDLKNASFEKKLTEKIEGFHDEISNMMNKYSLIPKDNKHPISILLDRINMQANGIEPGFTTPQQLEDIRKGLLQLYEQNKPEVISDIEEVYDFVNIRMRGVIENGCSKSDVKRFYEDYLELQRKYLDKGYRFKN